MSNTSLDCIENFSFIAVDSATDIQNDLFSGIVGLAPKDPDGSGQIPSFVEQGEKIFSFYLSKEEGALGKITLGGYDLNSFAATGHTDEASVQWISILDDMWKVPLTGFGFKDGEQIPIKATRL